MGRCCTAHISICLSVTTDIYAQTEIYFDFTKTTISNIVNDYFTSRILDENENEKDWFSKVVKGVKLKNAKANQLLIV